MAPITEQASVRFALAATAVILCGSATGALAQDLFTAPSVQSQSLEPQVRRPGVLRQRSVVVNQAIMTTAFAKNKKPRTPLKIELFPGLTVTLKPQTFDPNLGGNATSWSGTVEGRKYGYATLVQRGDGVVGQIQIGGQMFQITPQGRGAHTIAQVIPQQLKGDIAVEAPGSLRAKPLVQPQAVTRSKRIRVLVIYTDRSSSEALAAGSNIADEARLAIATANATYDNTRLRRFKLQLASTRLAGCRYDENAHSYSQMLYDITDASTCIGERASRLRNHTKADLVAVLRSNGSYCGIAWVNSSPAGQDRYGFSVTSRNCISNHSFTHELGHNMGLKHDRYVSSGSQSEFNFGFVALNDRIRSIMAYNSQCSDNGFFCPRVQTFSSVVRAAWWNGTVRMGRSTRQSNPADNRSKLEANWDTISNWR